MNIQYSKSFSSDKAVDTMSISCLTQSLYHSFSYKSVINIKTVNILYAGSRVSRNFLDMLGRIVPWVKINIFYKV